MFKKSLDADEMQQDKLNSIPGAIAYFCFVMTQPPFLNPLSPLNHLNPLAYPNYLPISPNYCCKSDPSLFSKSKKLFKLPSNDCSKAAFISDGWGCLNFQSLK